jgi:hypothetical protein
MRWTNSAGARRVARTGDGSGMLSCGTSARLATRFHRPLETQDRSDPSLGLVTGGRADPRDGVTAVNGLTAGVGTSGYQIPGSVVVFCLDNNAPAGS